MTPIAKFVSFRRLYKFEQTFQTNISANYLADSGSNWGVWEMLRESIQNMMDEAEYMADNIYRQSLINMRRIEWIEKIKDW